MKTVKCYTKDRSGGWFYYTKDLQSAIKRINEDIRICNEFGLAIVFDEKKKKIFEVKK